MKKTGRIQLKQETLRTLDSRQLLQAGGGVDGRTVFVSASQDLEVCCCSFYCPSDNLCKA